MNVRTLEELGFSARWHLYEHLKYLRETRRRERRVPRRRRRRVPLSLEAPGPSASARPYPNARAGRRPPPRRPDARRDRTVRVRGTSRGDAAAARPDATSAVRTTPPPRRRLGRRLPRASGFMSGSEAAAAPRRRSARLPPRRTRPVSTEYPARGRGAAATRPRGIPALRPARGRRRREARPSERIARAADESQNSSALTRNRFFVVPPTMTLDDRRRPSTMAQCAALSRLPVPASL